MAVGLGGETRIYLLGNKGQKLGKLSGMSAQTNNIAFSPVLGPPVTLVAGCADGKLVLWNVDAGEPAWAGLQLKDGKTVTFGGAGRILHGDPEVIERELVYLVEKPDGMLEVLRPSEFSTRAGEHLQSAAR